MPPKPTPSLRATCHALAALLFLSQWALATQEQIAHLSIYYLDRAIQKTNTDYILLVDGRSLAIERGRLIAPQSRVTTNWNDFYSRSESPPLSDVSVKLSMQPDNSLIVCLSERCANVVRVCPSLNIKPMRPCLPPQSITNLQEVK